jgi:sporulation integral membrane protein YlbJ
MTEKKNKTRKITARGALLLLSLLLLAIFLIFARSAADYARRALTLVATALVPSLFPFMVISDLLYRCGFVSLVGKHLEKPMRKIFRISGEGAGVMLLGMLCGFPIGAKCAVALYDSGSLGASECERLITLSSLPSAAFCISTVGLSLFSSIGVGIALYLSTVLSSFVVGAVVARLFRTAEENTPIKKEAPPRELSVGDITEAVTSSAIGVVKISGFVVFFSVVLGVLGDVAPLERLGGAPVALLYSLLELTSGVAKTAALSDNGAALFLTAFALGWSSLSIHLQITSLATGRALRFSRYLISKLLVGVISAVLVRVGTSIFPASIKSTGATMLTSGVPSEICYPILCIFLISFGVAIAKKVKSW